MTVGGCPAKCVRVLGCGGGEEGVEGGQGKVLDLQRGVSHQRAVV